MPIYRRAARGVWYVDIRRGRSGRIRRSLGTTDRAIAQRRHDEIASRLWKQKQGGRQLSDALLAWLKARPRSRADESALRLIRREYPDRPLPEVTEASLIDAFGARSAPTYNRITTTIRSALRMAERAGWIDRAPDIQRRRIATPPFRWLTPAEWQKVRAELPEHLQRMADFAIATGLRWGNVAGLTWEQVSLERRHVTVEAARAKGRKPLAIPLSSAAVATLRRVPGKREGYVFAVDGKPLRYPKEWQPAVKRAGVAPVKWHDLRHTWASWHVQNGTPLAVLRELGGWASLGIVMAYAHLAPSHLARYAGNAAPRARKAA